MIDIRRADKNDIPLIRDVAYAVWPGAYSKILSNDQLEYMLDMFYSDESLLQQMSAMRHRFFIAEELSTKNVLGFVSFSLDNQSRIVALHKLYVMNFARGRHIGTQLIERVISETTSQNPIVLRLNVNRYNTAVDFYKKIGFTILKSEDNAIGKGYFMNDYVMERRL